MNVLSVHVTIYIKAATEVNEFIIMEEFERSVVFKVTTFIRKCMWTAAIVWATFLALAFSSLCDLAIAG